MKRLFLYFLIYLLLSVSFLMTLADHRPISDAIDVLTKQDIPADSQPAAEEFDAQEFFSILFNQKGSQI